KVAINRTGPGQPGIYIALDYNGDGKDDLLEFDLEDNTWRASTSAGSSFNGATADGAGLPADSLTISPINLGVSGRHSVVVTTTSSPQPRVFTTSGDGKFSPSWVGTSSGAGTYRPFPIDVDDDGLPDLVVLMQGTNGPAQVFKNINGAL